MRESQARTQRDRETLVREAHFLCRMRSPHVLRSLGVSETVDKLPCLLLEWCASDLKRALQLELVGTDPATRKAVLAEWPPLHTVGTTSAPALACRRRQW